MVDPTSSLPGLSPVHGQVIVARFDGGRLSSEGGLLALREAWHCKRRARWIMAATSGSCGPALSKMGLTAVPTRSDWHAIDSSLERTFCITYLEQIEPKIERLL
jgi:hypothetical protein